MQDKGRQGSWEKRTPALARATPQCNTPCNWGTHTTSLSACVCVCRLCLFLVLTANLALERLLAAYCISAESPLLAHTAEKTGVSGRGPDSQTEARDGAGVVGNRPDGALV